MPVPFWTLKHRDLIQIPFRNPQKRARLRPLTYLKAKCVPDCYTYHTQNRQTVCLPTHLDTGSFILNAEIIQRVLFRVRFSVKERKTCKEIIGFNG